MKKVVLKICPFCGQLTLGLESEKKGVCPVCNNVWKLHPQDKIEVRLSV